MPENTQNQTFAGNSVFRLYDSTTDSPILLLDQIISNTNGIEIDLDSINFIGEDRSTSFFETVNFGQSISLNQPGILLTSGDGAPPLENTEINYTISWDSPGDAQLTQIAQNAFGGAGTTNDAAILEFAFTRTNPNVNSISFDVLFGSEEYPEFINSQFVDIAAITLNGTNFARIEGDPNKPLSIIGTTVEDGRFVDNLNNILPIEYNGITRRLSIPIPLETGRDDYFVRIGIADTGDTALDSGLFVSNFRTSTSSFGEIPLTVIEAPTLPIKVNHKFLELLAKDLVYQDWGNNKVELQQKLNQGSVISGIEYYLDPQAGNGGIWGDDSKGFYAIGLISDDPNAPPILAIRGSDDAFDWLQNTDIRGVGFEQFHEFRSDIVSWLESLDQPAYITGHSLGGALSQWFGSYITDTTDLSLGEIVTFNSPGISPIVNFEGNTFGSNLFDDRQVLGVTHYTTSADAVSLAGRNYLNGAFKQLQYVGMPPSVNFQTFIEDVISKVVLEKHLNPILDPTLVDSLGGTVTPQPFSFLNSPVFNYGLDSDFLQLRGGLSLFGGLLQTVQFGTFVTPFIGVPVALFGEILRGASVALGSRLTTETFRTELGLGIEILSDLLDALEPIPQAISDILNSAYTAIVNGGTAALEAVTNFSVETWEAISSWGVDAWNTAGTWTNNTWNASKDFTIDTWNSITNIFTNVTDNVTSFIIDNSQNIFEALSFTLSPILPVSAVFSLSETGNEVAFALSDTGELGMDTISSQTIEVSINISSPSEDIILLEYSTADGSAVEGIDYVASGGILTFQPGETEKFIPVEILGLDTWSEGKTFNIVLENAENVLLFSEQITVTVNPNNAPVLLNPIESQDSPINEFFDFQIPDNTFFDEDLTLGDSLTYTATLVDGSSLPSWLTFDPVNLIFSGSPENLDIDNITVVVTAIDEAQESVSAEFVLNVIVPENSIIQAAGPNTGTLFEDNEGNNAFEGSTAADVYNLTLGSANVILGTPEQLHQDIIINFESNDVILVKNAQFTQEDLTVTFGSATLSIDTNGDGQSDTTITLDGEYSDSFVVNQLQEDTMIVYTGEGDSMIPPSEQILTLNEDNIQILYLALTGRPADSDGQEFWRSAVAENNISYSPSSEDSLMNFSEEKRTAYQDIINDFASSDETIRLFGENDNLSLINLIYNNVFNRSAEEEGLNYWNEILESEDVNFANLALEITLGAVGSDVTILSNKIVSAELFTERLDSLGVSSGYVGEDAEKVGFDFLSSVGNASATRVQVDDVIFAPLTIS
ncbi:MAG: choice-of-anchor L domain-containing protein [Cyanobacterium sp.]